MSQAKIELIITLKGNADAVLCGISRALVEIGRVARLASRRRLYRKTWRVRK